MTDEFTEKVRLAGPEIRPSLCDYDGRETVCAAVLTPVRDIESRSLPMEPCRCGTAIAPLGLAYATAGVDYPSVIFLALIALALLGIAVILVRWRRMSGWGRVGGAAFALLVLVFLTSMFTWTATVEVRAPVAEVGVAVPVSSRPAADYRNAWDPEPAKGSFPAWVKAPALLAPEPAAVELPRVRFTYLKQDGQGRIAGHSGFEPQPEAAVERAWGSARERLEALAIASCAFKRPDLLGADPAGPSDLRGFVEAELASRRQALTIESYCDTVEFSYGPANRAAVLVNAAPATIEEIAGASLAAWEKASAERQERERHEVRTWAYSVAAGVLLLAVVLAIYLFFNAHTKGYYAWPLRILALAIYVAAVGATILLVRHYSP